MGLPSSSDRRESMMLSWAEGKQSLCPILIQGLPPWSGCVGLRDTWQEVHLLASASGGPLWVTNSCPLHSRRTCRGIQGGWGGQHFCSDGKSVRGAYDDWTNILLTNVDVQTEIITRIKGKN